MAAKRILSWAPDWSKRGSGGRWRKYVDGKAYFFGHGKSKEDVKSYREAEKCYLEFLKKHEAQAPVEISVTNAMVEDVAEKYLQMIECRYVRAEISASYFTKTTAFINRFAKFIGLERLFWQVTELDLNDFRIHILGFPASGEKSVSRGKPISAATARDILFCVKNLYQWAYELHLCEMPRNMRNFAKCTLPKPEVKTFSVLEIRKLWEAADQRLRCFMALALNCGYGQKDIADLQMSEVDWENGVIDRLRSKTGVRQRHKLWPVTLELLKKEHHPGAKGNDRVFKTERGLPLVHNAVIEGVRKQSDSVKCMFWRVQQSTGILGGRGFYCLRKTAATEIEKINPLVTEMFLAHTEKGMKKHYTERHFEPLDEAIMEMAEVFSFVE